MLSTIARPLGLALLLTVPAVHAQTVLTGNFVSDNAFYVFLSTNANSLGSLIDFGNTNFPASVSYAATPTTLAAGTTYYVNVEAINYGLAGGLLGSLTLSNANGTFSNGTQSLLTNTTDWLASYNSSNSSVSQQPWVAPVGGLIAEGTNTANPTWGTQPGIPGTAQWIWANDSRSYTAGGPFGGVCQFCTVDFSTKFTTAAAVPEPSTTLMLGAGLCLVLGVVMRRRGAC